MATWGIWSDELDDLTLSQLVEGYVRRKRWEARLLAVEVSKLFAKPAQSTGYPQPPPTQGQQVSSTDIFQMMGVEWPSD